MDGRAQTEAAPRRARPLWLEGQQQTARWGRTDGRQAQDSGCRRWGGKCRLKAQQGINRTNVFLGQSPKAVEIKTKINQWDLSKFTSFCTANETINKGNIGKQCNQQKLNFQNIKQLIQLNKTAKNKQPNQTMGRRLKQTFLLRHTDGQQAHEKMLSREMQVKTTMSYHLTLIRMAVIKKSTNNKC